eukprot:Blabericola_migrator_1__6200@NODE_312_length_10051_cov_151_762220_g255_i0_p2_GENE_NODE_312_length_10051_cov_151_762220_g255_i0NODE_312_length_10051_cov_151_762220_g255_i0_p2_ORF_typecomplete_len739_score121_64DNA_pol_A_exo1/PF01612_20/5_3e03DNA_pol_A_exo1/PF01612_20/8_3e40HRDC/PF00570_23/3_6e07_NODE_312_length_10051_cov_151_762220_g255_i046366852
MHNVLGEKVRSLLDASVSLDKQCEAVTGNFSIDPILRHRVPKLQTRIESLIQRLCVLNGTWEGQDATPYVAGVSATAPPGPPKDFREVVDRVVHSSELANRRLHHSLRMIPLGSARRHLKRRRLTDSEGEFSMETVLKKRRRDSEPLEAKPCPPKSAGFMLPAQTQKKVAEHSVVMDSLEPRNVRLLRVPIIKEKPHGLTDLPEGLSYKSDAIIAAEEKLRLCVLDDDEVSVVSDFMRLEPVEPAPHPYGDELEALRIFYESGHDEWDYSLQESIMDNMIMKQTRLEHFEEIEHSLPPIMITDGEGIQRLVDTVLEASGTPHVLAIDVEHHSMFSYRGVICLMQMTFMNQDYIIDCLAIPRAHLNKLNQVLACPAILKVLHGSHYDCLWLQEVADLYLVNVFDTFYAAKLLKSAGGNSLAALVELYCNVKLDKTLTTSDWRKRPLSPELIAYARMDTHYLPYIFHCMKNQILTRVNENVLVSPIYDEALVVTSRGRKQILTVLEQSRQLCLNRVSYSIPDFQAKAAKLNTRYCAHLTKGSTLILARLLALRDLEARREDVCVGNIASDSLLLAFAEKLPRSHVDIPKVLGLSNVKFSRLLTKKVLNIINHGVVIFRDLLQVPAEPTVPSLPQRAPAKVTAIEIPVAKKPESARRNGSSKQTLKHEVKTDLKSQGDTEAPSSCLPIEQSPIEAPFVVLRGGYLTKGRELRLFAGKRTGPSSAKIRPSGLGKVVQAIVGN